MTNNKDGLYDKAKNKGKVIEGGIKELQRVIEKEESDKFKDWDGEMKRISVLVPCSLRNSYKACLAKHGITIQADIEDHMLETVNKMLASVDKK